LCPRPFQTFGFGASVGGVVCNSGEGEEGAVAVGMAEEVRGADGVDVEEGLVGEEEEN